jgi:hypothetical protein
MSVLFPARAGMTDVDGPDCLRKKRKMRMAQPAGKQNEEQRKK